MEACTFGVDESAISDQEPAVRVHPNPASGIVDFQFGIAGIQRITFKIYDLHGREMATVVDEVMQPGDHVISFDTGMLPAGIYISRISGIDNRQSTMGKLVVVR